MADLVGEAWVRITADTTAMRQAIHRAAKKDGDEYAKTFVKQVNDSADDILKRQRSSFARAFADPKEFDRLAKNYKSIEDAAKNYRVMLDDINEREKFGAAITSQYTASINKWEKQAIAARKAAFDLAEQDKAAAEAKARQTRELRNFFTVQEAGYKRMQASLRANEKAIRDQERAWSSYGKNLLAASQIEEQVIVRQHTDRWDKFRNATVAGLDKSEARFQRFNFLLGASFGRGSRNNFFNWLGSMVRGISSIFTTIPIAIGQRGVRLVDKFFDSFSAARIAGFGKFASSAKGLLAVFGGPGGIVAAIAGLIVGAITLGKVLPGIVSLMTQLAGVVSALVGSISIGLVGGLLAVAPAAVGAVAGVGALFGVFTQFFRDDKNEKFVERLFKPFKDMNKSYYPQVRKFLTTTKEGFDDLIKDIRPSLDSFFAAFDKGNKKRGPGVLADPSTIKALSKWSDSIGRIANSMSKASTSLVSGLIGFFVPILPYAERLANYLRDSFATFDKWANSAGGRKEIANWMQGAWENAKKVWDILQSIAGIIGDVFTIGDPTGKSFLDGIAAKLSEIDELLDTPEGEKKLSEWFGSVKEIGEDIGSLASNVGSIIKNFNDPSAQKSAQNIMGAIVQIGNAAEKVSEVADAIGRIIDYLANPALAAITDILGFVTGVDPRSGKVDTSRIKPTAPVPTPTVTPPLTGGNGPVLPGAKIDVGLTVNGFGGSAALEQAMYALGMTPKQLIELGEWTIPVGLDTKSYDATKAVIEAFKFTGKTVPVDGNATAWNVTKGTVAGYAFDTKTVTIAANAEPLYSTLKAAQAKIKALTGTTVRIAGLTQGGLTVNASGAIYDRPTLGLVGEAGPEAIVPLNRPLALVDPAVRALSAIAQGKTRFASGGVVGASRTINVHPGAIVVQSPHSDPEMVASAVIDRLVTFG